MFAHYTPPVMGTTLATRKNILDLETKTGQRLKQARKAAGLKQTQLAAMLSDATGMNISQPMITEFESARLRLHTLLIHHLCRILNISSDWLLGLDT